jgi:hypothetical protein
MKVTDAHCGGGANERPVPSLGALVHGVVNSTASIAFSATALRAGERLSTSDREALKRIEQAAALVADTVKRFAAAAGTSDRRRAATRTSTTTS